MGGNVADDDTTQAIKNQERKIIEALAKQAIDVLLAKDAFLMENDVNERTITHKLAEYFQDIFDNWHVDCEYSKYYQDSKTLQAILSPYFSRVARVDDSEACTVFPDMIVHGRDSSSNLLVMEIRKSTSSLSEDLDMEKLRCYKQELCCKFAFLLILCCGKDFNEGKKYRVCWI